MRYICDLCYQSDLGDHKIPIMLSSFATLAKQLPRTVRARQRCMSSTMEELKNFDPFNPTEEHQALRNMVRAFTVEQVDGQRLEQ